MKIVPQITPAVRLGLVAAAIEACLLRFNWLGFRNSVEEAIILYIAISLFYLIAVRVLLGGPVEPKIKLIVLAAAVIFRLTAWPLAAPFSDDIYRYRWEGKLQAFGGNPYQTRPEDAAWGHLRDETWPRVGQKDVKAGYGPLAELLEHATYLGAARITGDPYLQAHWFKFPAAAFDLFSIVLLWRLLATRGVPVERTLIYAWAPAPVLEFWGNGHNDSIVICFILLALLAAARERWSGAFAALGAAAAAKLWPFILLPSFIVRRKWHWAIAVAVFIVAAIPYWSNVYQNARFMSGFLGGWRNNDSLYGFLLWLTGDQYRAKYLAFALLAIAAIWIALARWPLEKKVLATIVAMLLVSANVHPWYLTWFLPLLAFVPVAPLFVWLTLSPLFYSVLIDWKTRGVWDGSTSIRWWVYVPVLASSMLSAWRNTRR
jgi:alpha-1,6-mannosyltransferase